MSNFIVKQASDFKFLDFFSSFQNYVPANLYNEDWYVELKKIVNIIKDNDVSDKYNLTDSRIVLIAYKCLEKVETSGTEIDWFIAKNYAHTYTKKDIKSSEYRDFIDMYIGYNFTTAEQDEKAKEIESKLKKNLLNYVSNGDLSVPLFIKKVLVGKVVLATKPEIEFAPEPEVESSVEDETKEIKKQLKFAVMMFEDEDNTPKEKAQWEKRIKMLNLLLT